MQSEVVYTLKNTHTHTESGRTLKLYEISYSCICCVALAICVCSRNNFFSGNTVFGVQTCVSFFVWW